MPARCLVQQIAAAICFGNAGNDAAHLFQRQEPHIRISCRKRERHFPCRSDRLRIRFFEGNAKVGGYANQISRSFTVGLTLTVFDEVASSRSHADDSGAFHCLKCFENRQSADSEIASDFTRRWKRITDGQLVLPDQTSELAPDLAMQWEIRRLIEYQLQFPAFSTTIR